MIRLLILLITIYVPVCLSAPLGPYYSPLIGGPSNTGMNSLEAPSVPTLTPLGPVYECIVQSSIPGNCQNYKLTFTGKTITFRPLWKGLPQGTGTLVQSGSYLGSLSIACVGTQDPPGSDCYNGETYNSWSYRYSGSSAAGGYTGDPCPNGGSCRVSFPSGTVYLIIVSNEPGVVSRYPQVDTPTGTHTAVIGSRYETFYNYVVGPINDENNLFTYLDSGNVQVPLPTIPLRPRAECEMSVPDLDLGALPVGTTPSPQRVTGVLQCTADSTVDLRLTDASGSFGPYTFAGGLLGVVFGDTGTDTMSTQVSANHAVNIDIIATGRTPFLKVGEDSLSMIINMSYN